MSSMACYAYPGWSDSYDNVDENHISGAAIKFSNDSIYGVSVKVPLTASFTVYQGSYSYYTSTHLKNIYLWYSITTQSDATCQVGYSHATVGLGGIGVSLSPSGISFSAAITQSKQDFMLPSFTLYYNYAYTLS